LSEQKTEERDVRTDIEATIPPINAAPRVLSRDGSAGGGSTVEEFIARDAVTPARMST
jgi:hypothetical protein